MKSEKIDEGGRWFPLGVSVSPMGDPVHGFDGATMRDHFAGEALGALVSPETITDQAWAIDEIAKAAYALADAMIRARGAA